MMRLAAMLSPLSPGTGVEICIKSETIDEDVSLVSLDGVKG